MRTVGHLQAADAVDDLGLRFLPSRVCRVGVGALQLVRFVCHRREALVFLRKGLRSRDDEVDEVDDLVLARSAEPFGVLRSGETAGQATANRLAVAGDEDDDARRASRRALDPATEVLDLIDREPEDVAALLRSWVADRRS